ncbi:MAG: zf-HC2 domain-containing protein [Myxococcales bacterium]|nr:zf-HC2 domain-containing protein [Myxococcales bacterium]
MTAPTCIGEPVSWLRLERLALAELDGATAATVRAHLAACAACAGAFARIIDDARPLPRLVAAATAPAPWWRRGPWLGGGLALVTAAAVAVLALRVRSSAPDAPPANGARVKGVGVVVVTLVRERGGVVAFDPDDVRDDDRWKVQLTCAPGATTWVDVAVVQGAAVAFPLPAQPIACGNTVAVPGAFRITDGDADVCVVVAAAPPDRARLGAGDRAGAVCRTVRAAR